MESPEHLRRAILDYVLSQLPEGTEVERAERIASERVYGIRHDVWDVHSSDGRWWVITEPATNLYSHEQHPSMDEVFALHIGLLGRVLARQSREAPVEGAPRERLARTWRKYELAADALNNADEAEDFQAVGMKCRECLIAFAQEAAPRAAAPEGAEPKAADFKGWAALIAQAASPGQHGRQLRSYLAGLSEETWGLVSWLTHASGATRFDAIVAVDATSHLLETFAMALLGQEQGSPERCPSCGSYRLALDYRRDEWEAKATAFRLCEACGWEAEAA